MKFFLAFFIIVILVACKRNTANLPPMQGLWVEKSLRLDSIEFKDDFSSVDENKFSLNLKSQPYTDVNQNPDYPINHSSIYSYYIEGQYILLYNFISSSSLYNKYDFKLNDDKQSFTIKRFYGRNSLPGFIEFERIK